MYVIITSHCLQRAIERMEIKKDPEDFIIHCFRRLMSHYKEKTLYKGRVVRLEHMKEWKKKLSDGHHKFVYVVENSEYIMLTYSKKSVEDRQMWEMLKILKIKN